MPFSISNLSHVKSTSNLKNTFPKTVRIPIKVITEVDSGVPQAIPSFITMNMQVTEPEPQQINHIYTFQNKGPSEIAQYNVELSMPVAFYDKQGQIVRIFKPHESAQPRNTRLRVEYQENEEAKYIAACDRIPEQVLKGRDAVSAGQEYDASRERKGFKLTCDQKRVVCQIFSCNFGEMKVGQTIRLKISGNVVPDATKELQKSYKLVSDVELKVKKLPYAAFETTLPQVRVC